MGIFTKAIGPVFLKASNEAVNYVDKLKDICQKCTGELKEEIEKQIVIAEYGIKGEECIAFELKNSDIDMYILKDICIEYKELSAQIDYLIVTRKRTYIIECKNLIGDIEINSAGDFIRTYQLKGRKVKEGIYSPITQNTRHLHVIRELRKSAKGNIISQKIFDTYFDQNYKSIVVLANSKTVLNAKYAKKEVKEQIVRADQLLHKIKEMDNQVKDSMSEKTMLEVANFFLERNQPNRLDYAEKYEKLLSKVEELSEHGEGIKEAKGVCNDTVEVLRQNLKAFRLKRSREENIKPYFIFNDAQMEDLLSKNPKNKTELCQVSGFGSVKAEKYGEDILRILQGNK
ncbi:MAG: HRDC domain-containing protein [Lachnospiraceae bacterium]|nr:HRDC domain-containing protein [Lachnospiraceae bacterium]